MTEVELNFWHQMIKNVYILLLIIVEQPANVQKFFFIKVIYFIWVLFIHLLICLSSCLSICLSALLSIHHSLSRKKHRLSSILSLCSKLFAERSECFFGMNYLCLTSLKAKIRHRCVYFNKQMCRNRKSKFTKFWKDANEEILLLLLDMNINQCKWAMKNMKQFHFDYCTKVDDPGGVKEVW